MQIPKLFQTIMKLNVCNILGAEGAMSTVDFGKEGVTRRVPSRRGVDQRREGKSSGSLTPAHEVDNLQAIAFGQSGFSPLIAGNDAAVQFHGDAIRFHPQLVD
jgi:hypothetical protein